jgi:hypothetical protein
LTPSQYELDRENRTATVRVMPGEALRINRIHGYDGHEGSRVEEYPIEEISAAGVNGGFKYTGRMTLTSFSEVSGVLYTLTYK